jgi:predicted DCC family thiol-disulfide oxidoreductase YuxK
MDIVTGPHAEARNPILVFDGDCGFCTSSAEWVCKHLAGAGEAVAWQRLGEEGLRDIGLTVDQASASAWWMEPDGSLFEGGEAIGKALAHCRRPWRWAGLAILVPPGHWLAGHLYPVIARNRHRLPGGTPACRVESHD